MTTTTTAPNTTTASPMLAGLTRALALVEAQIDTIAAQGGAALGTARDATAAANAYRLDDLEVFAERLRQIKQWLEQDHHLLTIVDDHISQQARRIDRRQSRREYGIAAITTVIGAALGWLFSAAATPPQILHLLLR